jgi:hypothetical protein
MASPPDEEAGTAALSPGNRASFWRARMDAPHGGTGWWARQDSNLRQHRYERSDKARTTAEILGSSLSRTESGFK